MGMGMALTNVLWKGIQPQTSKKKSVLTLMNTMKKKNMGVGWNCGWI